jgi:hypothetical protein
MVRNLAAFAAWAAFGLICFVTLSPIGLRPQTGDPGLERFVAYAVLGSLFMTAYPRYFTRLATFLAVAALALEVLQHLTPDRDGHLADGMEKVLGAWAGCAAIRFTRILTERPRSAKAE